MIGSMPVREPAYMHSFGLTERFLVLAEFPFVVNPLALALARRPYIENYRWKPQRGTRFTLFDRASGEVAGELRTRGLLRLPPRQRLRATASRWWSTSAPTPTPGIVEDLYLERLRAGKPLARAELARFRLDPRRGSVTRERLAEEDLELPRINYGRCNERPYRYAWGLSCGRQRLARADREGRHRAAHDERPSPSPASTRASRCSWPRPGAEREDDGVLLSVVLDAEAGQLDADRARRGRAARSWRGPRCPTTSRSASTASSTARSAGSGADLIQGGALGGGAARRGGPRRRAPRVPGACRGSCRRGG